MNIRELRPDNYIHPKENYPIMQVTSVYKGSSSETVYSRMKESEGDDFETDIEDCTPIPFTTEWAERFKLLTTVINGLCIHPSEYEGHEYDLCLYDENTWESERRVICPIYHVHQCQNIFLDLAGHILE